MPGAFGTDLAAAAGFVLREGCTGKGDSGGTCIGFAFFPHAQSKLHLGQAGVMAVFEVAKMMLFHMSTVMLYRYGAY